MLTRSAWQAPNSSVDESWRFWILACGCGDDSHWVRDSEAFLSGPLFLAGLFLRHGDSVRGLGLPRGPRWSVAQVARSNLGCRSLTALSFWRRVALIVKGALS